MSYLKRISLLAQFVLLFAFSAPAQSGWFSWNKSPDLVIQRDGTMSNAKIMFVGKDKTTYTVGHGKNVARMEVANSDLFMLRFKERGCIVFDDKGERILTTSTSEQYPKGAVLLFLCNGQIQPVYNLSIDQNVARYTSDKKGEGRKGFLAKSDIFMVCYPNGSHDVITSLIPSQPQVKDKDDMESDSDAVDPALDNGDDEEEEAPVQQSLKRVTLVLTNGAKLNVWLVKEERQKVSYKKENSPKASTFVMQKSRIRRIVR